MMMEERVGSSTKSTRRTWLGSRKVMLRGRASAAAALGGGLRLLLQGGGLGRLARRLGAQLLRDARLLFQRDLPGGGLRRRLLSPGQLAGGGLHPGIAVGDQPLGLEQPQALLLL